MTILIATILSAILAVPSGEKGSNSILEKISTMPPSRIVYCEKIFDPSGAEISSTTGTLEVQYPCFSASYGPLIITGDGVTMWCIDTSADEVTISSGSVLEQLVKEASPEVEGGKTGITFTTSDGRRRVFKMLMVEEMESKWPQSHFTVDTSSLGDNTVITDLR